jgi:hypothetical protein
MSGIFSSVYTIPLRGEQRGFDKVSAGDLIKIHVDPFPNQADLCFTASRPRFNACLQDQT